MLTLTYKREQHIVAAFEIRRRNGALLVQTLLVPIGLAANCGQLWPCELLRRREGALGAADQLEHLLVKAGRGALEFELVIDRGGSATLPHGHYSAARPPCPLGRALSRWQPGRESRVRRARADDSVAETNSFALSSTTHRGESGVEYSASTAGGRSHLTTSILVDTASR
eukprot:scaffold120030_cov39-Tisochrysis_lutea.AAC.1